MPSKSVVGRVRATPALSQYWLWVSQMCQRAHYAESVLAHHQLDVVQS